MHLIDENTCEFVFVGHLRDVCAVLNCLYMFCAEHDQPSRRCLPLIPHDRIHTRFLATSNDVVLQRQERHNKQTCARGVDKSREHEGHRLARTSWEHNEEVVLSFCAAENSLLLQLASENRMWIAYHSS